MRHSCQTLSKWCHGKLLCEKWNLLQAAAPSFRNEPCLERRVSDASMVAVSSQCRRSTFRSSPYRDSGLVQNALCDVATVRKTPNGRRLVSAWCLKSLFLERLVEAQRAHGPECEPDRPILRI